jgi:error-prone DNA polymerase
MVFAVCEDETGTANLVIAPAVLLDGHVEREHDVVNVVVHHAQMLEHSPT